MQTLNLLLSTPLFKNQSSMNQNINNENYNIIIEIQRQIYTGVFEYHNNKQFQLNPDYLINTILTQNSIRLDQIEQNKNEISQLKQFAAIIQLFKMVYGTRNNNINQQNQLSLVQLNRFILATALDIIPQTQQNITTPQWLLINYLKGNNEALSNNISTSQLKDKILHYIQNNDINIMPVQLTNFSADPFYLIAKYIRNELPKDVLKQIGGNQQTSNQLFELFDFLKQFINKKNVSNQSNQTHTQLLQFFKNQTNIVTNAKQYTNFSVFYKCIQQILRLIKVIPDNQVTNIEQFFADIDNLVNAQQQDTLNRQLSNLAILLFKTLFYQQNQIKLQCLTYTIYKINEFQQNKNINLQMAELSIYHLNLLLNQSQLNNLDQQLIKQTQIDLFSRNMELFLDQTHKSNFTNMSLLQQYVFLSLQIDKQLNEQFIKELTKFYEDKDVNIVIEFLQQYEQKKELEKLIQKQLNQKLIHRCGNVNEDDINVDQFCLDVDLSSNPNIKQDLTLMKDLGSLYQKLEDQETDFQLMNQILQYNQYQNINKGVVCDVCFKYQNSGAQNSDGTKEDYESALYQFMRANTHWRSKEFAPALENGEQYVDLSCYLLLSKLAETL